MSKHPLFNEKSKFSKLARPFQVEGKLLGYLLWHRKDEPRQEPELLIIAASDPGNLLTGSFTLHNAAPALGLEICYPPGANKALHVFLFSKEMVANFKRKFGIQTISEMFKRELLESTEKILGIEAEARPVRISETLLPKGWEACRCLSAVPFFSGALDSGGKFTTEMQLGDSLPLNGQYLIAVIDM